jgi:hypothetical protein
MFQNIILGALVFLCFLLLITIIIHPFDVLYNCIFKIQHPRIKKKGNKRIVSIEIEVSKQYRYFINFPILFRFFSNKPDTLTHISIYYIIPESNKKELLYKKQLCLSEEVIEFQAHITDIIIEKIVIEMDIDLIKGNPLISFELLESDSCKEENHKVEIKL